MAEIIKKEVIKVRNGDLKKLCRKHNTSIPELAEVAGYMSDMLYKFDRGEKAITWEAWEKITNYLKQNEQKTKKLQEVSN